MSVDGSRSIFVDRAGRQLDLATSRAPGDPTPHLWVLLAPSGDTLCPWPAQEHGLWGRPALGTFSGAPSLCCRVVGGFDTLTAMENVESDPKTDRPKVCAREHGGCSSGLALGRP